MRAVIVALALVVLVLAAPALAKRHKQGVLAHHKKHIPQDALDGVDQSRVTVHDTDEAEGDEGHGYLLNGENNPLYVNDPELKALFSQGHGNIQQEAPGTLAVQGRDAETGEMKEWAVPTKPLGPGDVDPANGDVIDPNDPDPTPEAPSEAPASSTDIAHAISQVATFYGGGAGAAPEGAAAAPEGAAEEGSEGAPPPTAFAVLSEMVHVSHRAKEDPTGGFKCNPDGSVAMEENCPAPKCPPCDAGAGGPPETPPRGIRVLEYAPNEYPFGVPKVLAESGLNPKRAKQIRAVLSGEVAKKEKEVEEEVHVEDRSEVEAKEARELEALEERKARIKYMHMTPEEKVEKALLKVLDSMGIQPTEVVQTPVTRR